MAKNQNKIRRSVGSVIFDTANIIFLSWICTSWNVYNCVEWAVSH